MSKNFLLHRYIESIILPTRQFPLTLVAIILVFILEHKTNIITNYLIRGNFSIVVTILLGIAAFVGAGWYILINTKYNPNVRMIEAWVWRGIVMNFKATIILCFTLSAILGFNEGFGKNLIGDEKWLITALFAAIIWFFTSSLYILEKYSEYTLKS